MPTSILYPQTAQELAATITPTNNQYPFLDARRYGIDMTGATDSTAAMQSAHSMGLPINYPAGTVKFTSITMPSGGIVGAGYSATFFVVTDLTSTDSITCNANNAPQGNQGPVFKNFNITPSGSKAGGFAIVVNPTVGITQGARFQDLHIVSMSGINLVYAYACDILNCEIRGAPIGIQINNAYNGDSGDSSIVGSFISAAALGTCIHYIAAGGLKITGSKMLGGSYGVLLDYLGSSNTSDLLVTGCSIESQTTAGIQLQRQIASAYHFGAPVIVGNEFEPANGAYAIYTADSSQFLFHIVIGSNVVLGGATAGGFYIDYVTNATIDGNTITGSTGSVGVTLGSHNVNVLYGVNNIVGFTTPMSVSGSGNTVVTVP